MCRIITLIFWEEKEERSVQQEAAHTRLASRFLGVFTAVVVFPAIPSWNFTANHGNLFDGLSFLSPSPFCVCLFDWDLDLIWFCQHRPSSSMLASPPALFTLSWPAPPPFLPLLGRAIQMFWEHSSLTPPSDAGAFAADCAARNCNCTCARLVPLPCLPAPPPPTPHSPFSRRPQLAVWQFCNSFADVAVVVLSVAIAGNAIDGNWLTFVLFKFVFFGIFSTLLPLSLVVVLLLVLLFPPARFHDPRYPTEWTGKCHGLQIYVWY